MKADLKAETEQAQKWYQRETDKHFMAIKYKQALEEIRNDCNIYAKTESYVIDDTFNEFLEKIFDKINEVLNDRI